MTTAAEINGVTISYSDLGSGLPLVCLHGGMGICGRTLRTPGILNLANHGIRLIIPDQRGHGQSSRVSTAEYSHTTWANDVYSLVGHLGLSRVALLGHSYGGFIALECVVHWPSLFTHLVLVASSAGPVSVQYNAVLTDGLLKQMFRTTWPYFFAGVDKHWNLLEEATYSAEAYNAAFSRELKTYDLREYIETLSIPMLLVVGSNDPYRADMEWLAEKAPNARFCLLDRVGHFPFVEAEQDFLTEVSSFLTGHLEVAAATSSCTRSPGLAIR
ncbi:MAG: alpha/beta hydrolase [Anaerolineae bacterium]